MALMPLEGVLCHVYAESVQIRWDAPDTVIITSLPHRGTWCVAEDIDFARGKRFETANHIKERMIPLRQMGGDTNNAMNVVGHNDDGIELDAMVVGWQAVPRPLNDVPRRSELDAVCAIERKEVLPAMCVGGNEIISGGSIVV